jgi:hypothetical protein
MTTLGVPEVPIRRRRSISAECTRMESIAEEIQSTSTVVDLVAHQSNVEELA